MMKSSTSLFVCSLLIVLLDVISPGHGCNKKKPQHLRPYPLQLKRNVIIRPSKLQSVGATWAEITRPVDPQSTISDQPNDIQEYGIEYSVDDQSNYKKVPVSNAKDNSTTLRIENLKPNTLYFYRSYLIYQGDTITSLSSYFRTSEQ